MIVLACTFRTDEGECIYGLEDTVPTIEELKEFDEMVREEISDGNR